MEVIGISGWSGNGKTTLLENLIPALIDKGFSVSTLKHAHHKFDVDHPGKDSFRHREAGAKEVLISSKTRWALMSENIDDDELSVTELIEKMSPVDILLIEGFKKEDFRKIEIIRNDNDTEPLYKSDPTVIAVATDRNDIKTELPLLDLNDVSAIAAFIIMTCGLEDR
ncbi:molybdopterin-guanine dinucleotide biosynthesis protein B [Alphaproteobacteria bacterium 46_93_T64]|nr:molybdopterin-guanine dinucleotide biosynthesis protein B [Alphaproteobacteria bacterium 46_93_T64]